MTRPRVLTLLLIVGLTAGCATPYLENTLSPHCARVLAKPEPASMKSMGLAPWESYKLSEAERDARQEYSICQDQQRWVRNVPRIYPTGDLGPAPAIRISPVTCVSISPGMVTCY